ncbi:MAG: NAD(P)H-hydrate dehydratase, partial [SAR202 cluster bacterium]|nr:NAD(P)H-hydrate dehydratase [SAR202 cluster bacterium]
FTGPLAAILRLTELTRRQRPDMTILALDVPSGLNADTGQVDPVCVPAHVTAALGVPKAGLYKFPGADYAGQVRVVDIGIPTECLDEVDPAELLDRGWVNSVLPVRRRDSHKGSHGRVLVVGGSQSYIGAAYLACSAAARSGCGYVTLAAPFRVQAIVASRLAEATYLTLPETTPNSLSPETARVLRQALTDYDALLIGPGLGQHPSVAAVVRNTLLGGPPLTAPVVVDADALNVLSQTPEWWTRFQTPAVLTPHPGEMGRLVDKPIEHVQQDRWGRAAESAEEWDVTLALKGAFTVVASPQGKLRVSPFANPALATAGTGDVLAGVIAGLLAQGLSPFDAAAAGVYLHGLAGEFLREQHGEAGGVASDLLPLLPRALRAAREGSSGSTR